MSDQNHSPWGQPPPNQPPPNQPPPGYGYPAAPPGYGYPAPQTGTNGLAIASLVLAFFCSLAGLICGIIALNQIKQRPQGGQGLAIAGIVISALSIIGGIVYIAAVR